MIAITVIFGKEQVEKVLNNLPLNKEEVDIHQKVYYFKTIEEANAFSRGIKEAVGWIEVYIINNSNPKEIITDTLA